MRVTYDPEKREQTLRERGLDFDSRDEWWLWATRRVARINHVFSMRKANAREQARIAPLLEV
jgi:uncharacterized protein